MSRQKVHAVGGARTIPAPDPVARDYLLLALRLDQHIPGLVDGYHGPADLKAQVETEQRQSPASLRDAAAGQLARLDASVEHPERRRWLQAQLVALESHARALAGDPFPYVEHVTRCFDLAPERIPESAFEAAAEEVDRLLPGKGPLADRIAEWDAKFRIPSHHLESVVDWLVELFRDRADALFGLPHGESTRVSLVEGKPWSGYNWYDGGLRSRVDLNTDLPIRAADLLSTLPHETYPGHHLEHAWKEALLVEQAGWLEHSILLINAPECLLSEGLADLGRDFAVPPDSEVDLLVELYGLAHLPVVSDHTAAHDAALRQQALTAALRAVRGVRGNAALMLHEDGASRDEVLAYLRRWLLETPERAAKRLEFIEHPLWRSYVFVYFEGERLLRRWVDRGDPAPGERIHRFGRLLREPLTPSAVAAEAGPA